MFFFSKKIIKYAFVKDELDCAGEWLLLLYADGEAKESEGN